MVCDLWHESCRIPRLYAAASLKHDGATWTLIPRALYSAALCRGLIEANRPPGRQDVRVRIPRLYAAASLKHAAPVAGLGDHGWYSAALCRGLIEAAHLAAWRALRARGIPRLYAAASLKRQRPIHQLP